MEPLDRLSRALSVIGGLRKARSRAHPGRPDAATAALRDDPVQETRLPLARRVAALDLSDPGQRDVAVTLLMEHLLSGDFGAQALQTISMRRVLDDIRRLMDADPALRAELDAALRGLQQGGQG